MSQKVEKLAFFDEHIFSHTLAVLDYLPKLRRVMGLVVSSDFLHTVFQKNVSY